MNPNCLLFSQREREKMSRRSPVVRGWSGGAMVLGKLSVPRRPTNLDNSRARAIALAVGAGGGCLDILSPSLSSSIFFSFLSPSFGDGPI